MDAKYLQNHFSACYKAQVDAIFRFCSVRVSDREQALDLTQETFTRFWQSITQGTEIMNERAFLFTVAQRLIIDWYRKKKSLSLEALAEMSGLEEVYEPSDKKTHIDLEIETEGRYLLTKINKLNPSNGHAVYLRFIEGLSPPEI